MIEIECDVEEYVFPFDRIDIGWFFKYLNNIWKKTGTNRHR